MCGSCGGRCYRIPRVFGHGSIPPCRQSLNRQLSSANGEPAPRPSPRGPSSQRVFPHHPQQLISPPSAVDSECHFLLTRFERLLENFLSNSARVEAPRDLKQSRRYRGGPWALDDLRRTNVETFRSRRIFFFPFFKGWPLLELVQIRLPYMPGSLVTSQR